MAYLGNSFPDVSSGTRTREDFIGDGVQTTFLLQQPVPGAFEGNISVIVDNVNQQPEDAYNIVTVKKLNFNNQVLEFQRNKVVTQSSSGATGIIIEYQQNTGYLYVLQTSSADFVSTGSTQIVQQNDNSTTSTAFVTSIETLYGRGLSFTGIPDVGQVIYATHLGGLSYQSAPAAGSVTAETLADNLRDFSTVKYTAIAADDTFDLNRQEQFVNSLLVTVDGQIKSPGDDYSISNSGNSITFTTPMSGGEAIVIRHLSFSTVSRTAVEEYGSWTPNFTIGGGTSNLNFLSKIGVYNKIGRMVSINVSMRLIQAGDSTGVLTISGLPYISYGVTDHVFPIFIDECDSLDGVPMAKLQPQTSTIQLGYINQATGRWVAFDHQVLTNSSQIILSFSYMSAK
jgi:hypothetical protein